MTEPSRPRCPKCDSPNPVGQAYCGRCGFDLRAPAPPDADPPGPQLTQGGVTHRTAVIVTVVGGALMALGSFMPWVSARSGFGSQDVAGTTGDGVFSLGLGALVAIVALVHLERPASGLVRGGIITAGIVGIGIAIIDYTNVSQKIAGLTTNLVSASVGAGLYVLAIGSATAIFGAWRLHLRLAASAPAVEDSIEGESRLRLVAGIVILILVVLGGFYVFMAK